MTASIDSLAEEVGKALGRRVHRIASLPDELAYEAPAAELLEVARLLRDSPTLRFDMLVDLCGVDFLEYGRAEWKTQTATCTGFSRGVDRGGSPDHAAGPAAGRRFAVVYQLLSIALNHRVRLRVYCPDDEEPMIASVCEIWPSANWFEREAFDLFGIIFSGHPDLRRILTDYGFVGHPFRKDFPLIGNVEVRYDPVKRRVVYEPVSIEPRVLVPKVIRHDNRYDPALKDRPTRDGA